MPKPSDVGVIVGRFQVHKLHDAHVQLISSVYAAHKKTILVLGLAPTRVTIRNPLDFEARKQLLLDAFPKATVLYLRDECSDDVWSDKLDQLIEDVTTPAQSVTLYGGRDSFINHYTGRYPFDVLEPEVYLSGTELRKEIARQGRGTEDFRAGVIWATANGFPGVEPTVDVAIYRDRDEHIDDQSTRLREKADTRTVREWLLVKKPGESGWRFPGGFVQPSDTCYEQAARREVAEETGCNIGQPKYVASLQVDDWRYREEQNKIVTTLFVAAYISGPVRPADDVAEARWFASPLGEPGRMLVPEHIPLWQALLAYDVRTTGGLK